MTKVFSQKGYAPVTILVLLAFVVAILVAYSYFNPNFSLAKYNPLNYFRTKQDDQRIADLKKLEAAVLQYYEENNEMPAIDGWCGRISGVIHPEFRDAVKPYFSEGEVPKDPLRSGSTKDYFYYRVDRSHYILMAVLEIPRDQGLAPEEYNFVKCHDWPGDNIYNYQISNLEL